MHETTDHAGHEEEHDQRDEVLAFVNGPLMERRDEVPVGQNERGHARDQRWPHTAHRGDRDDCQQVQQQCRLQLEGVPGSRHDQGQQRQ
jgi:hypothetical protein